jgi:hypothetical protein
MIEHVSATAATRPCQLYAHSAAPHPSRTQGHHLHPEYLQQRLWGEVRDKELLWLCGLCHDSTHDMLGWLLGETRKPDPLPSPRAQEQARAAVNWYRAEQDRRLAAQ